MAHVFSDKFQQQLSKISKSSVFKFSRSSNFNPAMVIALVLFGAVGTFFLASSHAATTTASLEAEAGSNSGNITTVSDSTSSGNAGIKFGVTAAAGTPVSTATPAITDTTSANRYAYADALTVSGDTWTVSGANKTCGAANGMVCGFQWQRSSDSGSTWSNITDGDCRVLCQRTYRLQTTDIGNRIRVIITAGNGLGSSEAIAAATTSNATDLTCNTNVSTAATLNTAYQSATAGQVICLASGTYNWSPTAARSAGANVVVKPASGATVNMSFNPNGASYVTVAGPLTMTYSEYDGTTNNVTVYNATLAAGDSSIVLFTDKFNNNNIVFDNMKFSNQLQAKNSDGSVNLSRGRIKTDFHSVNTSKTIGVTVSNSYFSDNAMIMILAEGGSGLTILNNEFFNEDNTANEDIHSDTIFNYGADHLVMKNNWFHDMTDVPGCGFTQWDGGDANVFENNVISHVGGATGTEGCYESMALNSDGGSIVNHNVLVPGTGSARSNLGQVLLGYKTSEGPGAGGTIIRDNTMASIDNGSGGGNATFFTDHNLCVAGCTGGTGNQGTDVGTIKGSPSWKGGSGPTSFTGFALTANSLGVGKASDGTNMGLELPFGYKYPR